MANAHVVAHETHELPVLNGSLNKYGLAVLVDRGFFSHADTVGAVGQWRARHDARRLTRFYRRSGYVTGEDGVHNLETDFSVRGVRGAQGEAVHRGVREAGRRFARAYDARDHQSERVFEFDFLWCERPKVLQDKFTGLFVRDH